MLKLLKFFKWYDYLLIILIVVLTFSMVFLDLQFPELMSNIIKEIIGEASKDQIITIGIKMLIHAFSIFLLVISISFVATKIATRFSKSIRREIYRKVQDFSMNEINNFSIPSLITRTTNDIQQVQMVVNSLLRMTLRAPIMAIGAIIKIWGKSGELTFVTALGVFLIAVIITIIFMNVGPKFKEVQKNIDDLNLVTRESLRGIKVIRAHNAELYQEDKFEVVNDKLTKTNIYVNRFLMMMHPFMNFILGSLSLSIVWVGSYLIQKNSIDLPSMMAFSQYAVQVVMSFMMLTMTFMMLPRGFVSAKRVSEVLETKNKIIDDGKVIVSDKNRGEISFNNVFFSYPNSEENVLENINLKIAPGETVGIIGSTGSGKSTLINLLLRFYDVSKGEILIDGINIRNYELKELYKLISYVPQKSLLFSGTINSNLNIGKQGANEEEMLKALKSADIEKFVMKQKEQLNYLVAQEGKNFSGGQKQRLSIARALIKKPKIFIFDDSFSALDNKTDLNIRKSIKKHMQDATTIIISQRIGTIMNSDKIIVIDRGIITNIGTHEQLLKQSDLYYQIATSQIPMEEEENV